MWWITVFRATTLALAVVWLAAVWAGLNLNPPQTVRRFTRSLSGRPRNLDALERDEQRALRKALRLGGDFDVDNVWIGN